MASPTAAPSIDPTGVASDRLEGHPLLLFDGVCNFCHWAVQFIIARDPDAQFRFASLQSETGREVLRSAGLPGDVTTMILVEPDGRVSSRSSGALRVAMRMGGLWPALGVLLLVPSFLRDPVYELIARNRYRWFGQKDSCPMPDPALADRFLD